MGTATSKDASQNPEIRALMSKHRRFVQLVHQSHVAADFFKKAQKDAGVPEREVLGVVTSSKTRWNGDFNQLKRNNILAPFQQETVAKYASKCGTRDGMISVAGAEAEDDDNPVKQLSQQLFTFYPEDWDLSYQVEGVFSKTSQLSNLIEGGGLKGCRCVFV
jgi:hypothetical protein